MFLSKNLIVNCEKLLFSFIRRLVGVAVTIINDDFLSRIIPKFIEWRKTEEADELLVERHMKDFSIETYFSLEKVNEIDEGALRILVKLLGSFNAWNNKEWVLEQILLSGLPEIREAFKTLLYSDKTLAEKFDQMRKIKMMGSATISEILAHFDHTNYPIYNKRAKESLIKLGVKPELLPKSPQITGDQYREFTNTVKSVFKKVNDIYSEISDLLKLDSLFYFISEFEEEKEFEKSHELEEFDHDITIEHILQLR